MQFIVESAVMDLCTRLVEAVVHVLVPRVLDRAGVRSVVNCPACGRKGALARWAPIAVHVVAWTGVLVFSVGFTGTLLAAVAFVVMVVAAAGGAFDGAGFSTAEVLVSAGAVLAGAVITMLAGAAGPAWYHRCPPKRCNACGTGWPRPRPGAPFVAPSRPPVAPTPTPRRPAWRPEPIALRLAYRLALAGGLAGLLYLLCGGGFAAEVTPAWFLPCVFGVYGTIYQRADRLVAEGRDEAYRRLVGMFGIFSVIGLPPLLLRRWADRSIVVAVAGTLYWAVLLWLFFAVIFPEL